VVAVALLVVLAVALAGTVVVLAPDSLAEPPPSAALGLSVDAGTDRLVFTHVGGDAIDVRTLRLAVAVDGTPLEHQPPVPFFAARGFRAGPTGPFNSGADPAWTAGERASLRLASTNDPAIASGARVRATLSVDGHRVARLTARAE
jgi:FlaG/FlaF family flagellin (archaellin)